MVSTIGIKPLLIIIALLVLTTGGFGYLSYKFYQDLGVKEMENVVLQDTVDRYKVELERKDRSIIAERKRYEITQQRIQEGNAKFDKLLERQKEVHKNSVAPTIPPDNLRLLDDGYCEAAKDDDYCASRS